MKKKSVSRLWLFLACVSGSLFSLGLKSCLQYEARRWEDITAIQPVKFLKQNNVNVHWLTISGAGEFGLDLEGSHV